jgi:hypothetical protein
VIASPSFPAKVLKGERFAYLAWRQQVTPYTVKEKAKITAGAVAALVMTGMFLVLALAFLMAR